MTKGGISPSHVNCRCGGTRVRYLLANLRAEQAFQNQICRGWNRAKEIQVETLWSLSKALDINVRELISPQPSGMRIDRGASQFTAEAELANFKVSMLSSCPIGSTRDIYRAEFQPGEAKVSEPHGPNVIEHFILISGEARVGPAQDPVIMQPGDYITFSGNQSHVYEALELNTTAIVIMEYA